MTDLLQLLRSRVDPAKVKKVSGAKGGEWHSPCPICGGTDRFSVFPEQPGGELCQKHDLRGTWACVRGCGNGGDLISWFTEAELDAMAVHYACAGKVGAISILTAKGKPDKVAHEALSRSARILVALDADEDKTDGSNPGAEAWLWWKQTYSQAKLWPVPVGKDPGEAFALGINLADWIFAGAPLQKSMQGGCRIHNVAALQTAAQKPASTGLSKPVAASKDDGNLGMPRKNVAVAEREKGIEVFEVPTSVATFSELRLPDRVTHQDLLRSQSKHPLDDPECIIPCPKTEPPFWWTYHRDCSRFKCKGHKLCMLGVLRSQIFLEALNAEKNLSR